jgi:hypothetical protein
MTEYLVKWIGHLDELKRPENFPKEVEVAHLVEIQNAEELAAYARHMLFENFVRPQGVGVALKPLKTEETGKLDLGDYTFIPIHMLTHITPYIRAVSGIVVADDNDPTGQRRLPSTTITVLPS